MPANVLLFYLNIQSNFVLIVIVTVPFPRTSLVILILI